MTAKFETVCPQYAFSTPEVVLKTSNSHSESVPPRFDDSGQPLSMVSGHVQAMLQHGRSTETMLKQFFVSQGVCPTFCHELPGHFYCLLTRNQYSEVAGFALWWAGL